MNASRPIEAVPTVSSHVKRVVCDAMDEWARFTKPSVPETQYSLHGNAVHEHIVSENGETLARSGRANLTASKVYLSKTSLTRICYFICITRACLASCAHKYVKWYSIASSQCLATILRVNARLSCCGPTVFLCKYVRSDAVPIII